MRAFQSNPMNCKKIENPNTCDFIEQAKKNLENSYEKCDLCNKTYASSYTLKDHKMYSKCKDYVTFTGSYES